jgi:hypothetical protein
MNAAEFEKRLEQARAGEQLIYFVGESLRGCSAKRSALRAFYDGRVDLIQKRVGTSSEFAYTAVKRRRVEPRDYPLHLEPTVLKQTEDWNGR